MKKRIICLVLLLLCVVQLCIPAFAVENDKERVLRVGYSDYDNFIEKNARGQFEGYAVEYLEKIVSITGHKLEFIPLTWAKSLEMLENQEIDLVCSSNYTEARAEKFDYCGHNFGYIQGVLYTRKGNSNLYYEDFEHFNGMRVGQIKGSVNIELFKQYAERNNFIYMDMEYASEAALVAALQRGEVDAIANDSMSYQEGLKLLATFSSQPFYLMSYKGNDFMKEFDYALERINIENIGYQNDLYNKYYGNATIETDPHFTRKETELIRDLLNDRQEKTGKRVLRVAVGDNLPPLSYVNDSGELCGIYIDVLERVSEIIGIPFEFVVVKLGEDALGYNFYRNNDIDICLVKDNEVTREYEKDEASGIRISSPFFQSSKVLVAKRGLVINEDMNHTIAYTKNASALGAEAHIYFPNAVLVAYDTAQECIDAVLKGHVDMMIYDKYLADYQLLSPQNEGLIIIPSIAITEGISLTPMYLKYGSYERMDESAKDQYLASEYFISALNKAISMLKVEEVEDIVLENTIAVYSRQMPLKDIAYKYRFQLISIVIVILTIVATIVGWYYIERRNYNVMQSKNDQLADALRQAKLASNAKSDFLSSMSHEIRTPMNAVVGLTEIAKNHTDDPEKMRDYLKKIDTSSKVLLGIINNVLDMSAIENEKLQLAHETFDMQVILADIETLYSSQCRTREILFRINYDVRHNALIGDELRLKQIILNFVSNAFKFTPNGGEITVSVNETAFIDNQAFLRITVSDTGCGMSNDMKRKLFRPFEQESASTARRYGGSGLGLSIAKNLIDMMHGAVSVDTKIGVGTTFVVDIPFDCTVEQDENRLREEVVFDFTGKKLLLCEDNAINREIAVTLLEMVGFEVVGAENGAEALKAFRASAPYTYDGILMDIQMPIMDGYQTTQAIRNEGREDSTTIPIIAMTANAFSDDVSAALSVGMNAHIAKPIDPQLLYTVLRKHLDK
ncbi:MAG: transporter substrate-binding domain-containing protein [Oscillospiraceae bacterium]|nr:transporter substrate-binding domain-containing protein [Oscillospiraceae bacterium]